MGFHLNPKKVLLLVEPWGMKMQWKHTTLKCMCVWGGRFFCRGMDWGKGKTEIQLYRNRHISSRWRQWNKVIHNKRM